MNLFEEFDGLTRQRHQMRAAHFHAFRRDNLFPVPKIDFIPLCAEQFSRAHGAIWREKQGMGHGRRPAPPVFVNGEHELPNRVRC